MKYNFDKWIDRNGTNSLKYDARQMIFGNPDVIPLWVADMDFETPDFILEAIRNRLEHKILGYPVVPDSFYISIINWINKRYSWPVEKSWITLTPGVVPALVLSVLAFTDPGDEIIVQPPVYFPFFSSIEKHRRVRVDNPLVLKEGVYRMDLNDFTSKISPRTKMLILCSPHNPVGRVWKKEELEEICTICSEYNILVVSDEIHCDIVFNPARHIPYATLSEAAATNSITCMAASKTFNIAGLGTSYIIIPDERKRMMFNSLLRDYHLDMGNIPGMEALIAAYSHGEKWLDLLLQYLEGNIKLVTDFIHEQFPELEVVQPEGTFLLWINFNKLGLEARKLNDLLIHKAGLGFSDGRLFGKGGEGFKRMNIGCPQMIINRALLKLLSIREQNIGNSISNYHD